MIKLLNCLIAIIFFLTAHKVHAQLTSGDLMVVGFDADSSDFLAVVNFAEIPPHTIVYIRDDEWNGTAFTTSTAPGDGTLSWNSGNATIAPGTIILLNSLTDTLKFNANIGTLKKESSTNFDISGSGEGVFLYLATDRNIPTTFLSAVLNGPIAIAGTTLSGTSLTENLTAILLTSGTDIGAYKGNRIGLTKEVFLTEINKMTNWNLQDANGNQSTDGLAPELPFSTTPFSISFVDNTPPSLLSAIVESQTSIKVVFSEKISKISAESKTNYVFTPALTINAISYDSISKSALLTVGSMTSGTKYKLIANGFLDNSGNIQVQASGIDNLIFNTYEGNDIVITEIMYNIGVGDSLEYFEIYNKSATPISIGGIKLYGLTGILPQYSLASKEAVVIASDTLRFNRFFGVNALYDWEAGFLNNNGGTVGLRNSLGVNIDSVSYSDRAPWDSLPDGRGPSLEIIDPSKDNNVAANWRASATATGRKAAATDGGSVDVFGSPGKVTLPSGMKNIPKEADFIVYPNPSNGEVYFSNEVSGVVVDYVGRVVYKFEKLNKLNLRHFDSGIYIIKTAALEKKIIIQK